MLRSYRTLSSAMAIALVFTPSLTSAQRRVASDLLPGDEVRITVRGLRQPVQGAVSTNSRDTIAVLPDPRSAPTMIPWNTATRVQQSLGVSHPQGLVTGMRRGAIVSGLVALVISPFLIPGCLESDGSRPCIEVVSVVYGVMLGVGTATGGVLGLAIGAERWRDVPLPASASQNEATGSQSR